CSSDRAVRSVVRHAALAVISDQASISHEASNKSNYQAPDDLANLAALACLVRYPMPTPIRAAFGLARFAKGKRAKARDADLQFQQVRFFCQIPTRRDPSCRAPATPG